jgi:hypothetical protein
MAYEMRRVGLSLGVGDGRMFLRSLMAETSVPGAEFDSVDPDTDEHDALREVTPRPKAPSYQPDRESGLILKAARAPSDKPRKPNGTDE